MKVRDLFELLGFVGIIASIYYGFWFVGLFL